MAQVKNIDSKILNLHSGDFPEAEYNKVSYIKIPLNKLK